MLDINYIEIFKNFPAQAAVMLIAMIPVAELRVALPLGLTVYNLPVWQAFLFSVVGNIIPVFFIVYFIDGVSKFLMARYKFWQKFFDRLFAKTRIKFAGNYARYGLLALAIFVSIPLPMTGAWTGALASFLFQIPKKQAIIWVSLGVVVAGIIVTILTLSAVQTINIFQ